MAGAAATALHLTDGLRPAAHPSPTLGRGPGDQPDPLHRGPVLLCHGGNPEGAPAAGLSGQVGQAHPAPRDTGKLDLFDFKL